MSKELLQDIIKDFNPDKFVRFFREKNRAFTPRREDLPQYDDDNFRNGIKLGEIKFPQDEKMLICAFEANKPLSERSGKKAQYKEGKKILKERQSDAGIFIFYNPQGNFRFSLIYANYLGKKRDWSAFRRFTYFVSPSETNKTLLKQIGEEDFSSLDKIKDAFSVEKVTKEFYAELQTWYFWAMDKVQFSKDFKYRAEPQKDDELRSAINLIRLITRIIFIWFIRQKGIIPDTLFDKSFQKNIVKDFYRDNKSANYYNAILQNLFFGTLNQKMNERRFAAEGDFPENRKEYDVKTIYRYADKFLIDKGEVLRLFKDIPFLNGGLFDCLDREKIYIDGFSRNPSKQARIPDYLFFQENEISVDLSFLGLGRSQKVKGLFEILNSYNFTIDENTPVDQEVALDPELLGKVFENLLASYNPETATTARKATGSYYTPREIVDYMVDESLVAYLSEHLPDNESRLRHLLSYTDEPHKFSPSETREIITAINNIKILDPACGSGAFPMGMLHKLVHILHKLDADNKEWHEIQYQKAIAETEEAFRIGNKDEREQRLKEINDVFDQNINEPDYARKLYLIENCIYGVDIQPIAVQISKLRFFISLVIDQKVDRSKQNYGILSLPNLETKFAAANTLIGLEKPKQLALKNLQVEALEKKLWQIRHKYFEAKTRKEKLEYQKKDRELRKQLSEILQHDGWDKATASKIVQFDPYDQNTKADWFDPEWMFGVTSNSPLSKGNTAGCGGFDVVIGNPPYVFARESKKKGLTDEDKKYFYENYEMAEYQVNLYPLFVEKGTNLLRLNGCLCFITPNNWLTINTNKTMRKFILNKSDITLVNFYARVFESADVDSSIIIFQKSDKNRRVRLFEYTDGFQFIKESDCDFFLKQRDHVINIEAFKGNGGISDLMFKIESQADKLGSVADVKVGLKAYQFGKGKPSQTLKEKEERVFHSRHKIDDYYFKYLDGKDVNRYHLNWSGEYLKYGDHLAEPRRDFQLFSSKRILVRQIPAKPPYCIHACIAEETCLNDLNSMNVINLTESPEAILGIINSRLTSFWFIHKFGKMQRETFPQFKVNELAEFPLPKRRADKTNEIAEMSKQILAAKQKDPDADTSGLEWQIDQMVYKLYDLTPEEIAIVEGVNCKIIKGG